MDTTAERGLSAAWGLRLALVAFVLVWIFGPYELRAAIPIWVPFAVALGVELQLLVSALRSPAAAERPDRRPQEADRERFGYDDAETSDLLLVRDRGRELWIPYDGETGEELAELIEEAHAFADDEEEGDGDRVASVVRGERSRWAALRRFGTGLAVLALLGLTAWVVESRTGWSGVSGERRAEAVERFSLEASRIAGKQVTIRCDESRDYVGFVQHADGVAIVGGDRAYLTPEICYGLYRLAFEGETRSSETGRAIAVLAHEAWHLRGESNEGVTECYAVQSGVALGVRLGLSEERARQLMRQQLAENALRTGASAEYRIPAECRGGGRLDLGPQSSAFP